jgi:hypothetical protein
VGGNATDPKVATHSRSSSDVLARATSHSLEEWVGGEAADAVLSHPAPQALERWVGGAAACSVSPRPAWLHEVWAGQRNGYSSSSELMVIGDGIWMRAPPATPLDVLAAALNWPADTPVWTANICSSFCTVNVIRAARAWHCGSIVLNHCLWRWSTGSWGMVPRRSAICCCCVKPSHGKRTRSSEMSGCASGDVTVHERYK